MSKTKKEPKTMAEQLQELNEAIDAFKAEWLRIFEPAVKKLNELFTAPGGDDKQDWMEAHPDAGIFINPGFEEAILGYDEDDRIVYDFGLMIESLAKEYEADPEFEGDPTESAIEWIEYNTIRTLPYMDNPPVILYRFE